MTAALFSAPEASHATTDRKPAAKTELRPLRHRVRMRTGGRLLVRGRALPAADAEDCLCPACLRQAAALAATGTVGRND
jgi:hypothetical protein